MGQDTIPARTSNRKAREERMQQFDALAAFANMGDEPKDWAKFLRMWPLFFPDDLAKKFSNISENWPTSQESLATAGLDAKEIFVLKAVAQGWNAYTGSTTESLFPLKPPLIHYRDLLRAFWRRKDSACLAIKVLLGFHEQVEEYEGIPAPFVVAMPSGKPMIDCVTGSIEWEFGCQFQRAVYDLIHERWRAMICPWCARYFIAGKTAQKFCSTKCWGEKKQKQSNDYYHRKGRAERARKKTINAKSKRRGR